MKDRLKVLIIGFVWPEPQSSAAGLRMMQLIEMFIQQNYSVIFASSALETDYMADLSSIGVAVQAIELNSDTFDLFVKEIEPQMVLFDRFIMEEQFGWRVALNCPDALRILDTEDLHSLRISRQKAFKQNEIFKMDDLLTEELSKREIASILRCDISLLVSEFEIELLQTLFKIDGSLLFYLPILIDYDENFFAKLKRFEDKKDFIAIGNFLHEPNWNAVQYLKEKIWPIIKAKIPQAKLNVYGAYPSQKVFQLHSEKEGFLIKGRAENAFDVFNNSRILLAPIRFGAGIKGKLLEAMQNGTPSVTTSVGAEAMSGTLDWNGFVTDDFETFAQKAVDLYTNEKLWHQARANGVEIIKLRYRRDLFQGTFQQKVQKTFENLKDHRRNNFMGSLLQHHTLRSTEYMSRWIQERNRN